MTRTSFADDNLVHFKDFFPPGWSRVNFSIPGPGTFYQIINGVRLVNGQPNANSLVDTDGDTLPDQWETVGVTFQINGQPVFVDLPAMGADPLHHDLFVQLDWMNKPAPDPVNFQLSTEGQNAIRASFQNAPVWNPDGEPGIRLHLDAGPGSKTWDRTLKTWVDWPATTTATCGAGCIRRATTIPYSKYFVTTSICSQSGCAAEVTAASQKITALAGTSAIPFGRDSIFYYGISIDTMWQMAPNTTGILGVCDRTPGSTNWSYGPSGRNFSNGFLTSLGVFCPVDNAPPRDAANNCAPLAATGCTAGGTLQQRMQTTQHELGHSLGFQHFGSAFEASSTSFYKPNYISIMSYLYQLATYVPLDYSLHTLPTLTESSLLEAVGVHDPDGRPSGWYCTSLSPTAFNTASGVGAVMPASFPGAIDWNCNGFNAPAVVAPDPAAIAADIDHTGQSVHGGWNDWEALIYQGQGPSGTGASLNGQSQEPTVDLLETIVPPAERQAFDQLPTAAFKLTKSSLRAPVSVTYDASASRDRQGAVVEYRWSFNDGQQVVTTQPTITHVFRKPGIFVTQLTVQDNQNNVSRFPADERIQVADPIAPNFMGFEDSARPWTVGTGPAPTSGVHKTEGAVAAVVGPCGYQQLKSPAANTAEFLTVGDQVSVDVFVPATQDLSNPSWVGDVQLFAQIAAAGINTAPLGLSQSLTTLPRGVFSTLTFPVNASVKQSLLGDFPEAQLILAVNNGSCRAPLAFDNLRFAGDLSPRTIFHREGSSGLQVATSALGSFENTADWSSPQVTVRAESTLKTEGQLSLAASISGFAEVRSRAFSTTEITGETPQLSLDVFIPKPQPNVFWTGDLQVLLDCAAAGISNLSLGSQSLTGRFQNEFNALAFTVPNNVLTALRGNFANCRFLIRVNAATGAGTFFFDRMGFLP